MVVLNNGQTDTSSRHRPGKLLESVRADGGRDFSVTK
jgi:hypothetical protein